MDYKIIIALIVGLFLFWWFNRSTFGGTVQDILDDSYTSGSPGVSCDIVNNDSQVPRGHLPAGNYLGITKAEREGLLKKFIEDHN
jgi:hypothetical protein